jgi:hypothetical protein
VEPNGTLTKYKLAKMAEASFHGHMNSSTNSKPKKLVKDTQVTDYVGLINYWLQIKTNQKKRLHAQKPHRPNPNK